MSLKPEKPFSRATLNRLHMLGLGSPSGFNGFKSIEENEKDRKFLMRAAKKLSGVKDIEAWEFDERIRDCSLPILVGYAAERLYQEALGRF